MAGDRVIIVRILGIGFYADTSEPLTLTSRAGVAGLPATTIEGVVTDMSDQLSSEIGMFGTIGSDPTVSFSVLANAQTLSALMARGMTEVRDGTSNGVVRTRGYISPNPLQTITCDSTLTLQVLDTIRIGGSAMLVTSIVDTQTFDAQYIFGSVPLPIAPAEVGEELQGSVIYGMRYLGVDYQMGGIEQLPIIISTIELNPPPNVGNPETVIFRGSVSRVSLDTSAGQNNQIKVECQSLMGMILNKPFKPTPNRMVWLYKILGSRNPSQLYDFVNYDNARRYVMKGVIRPELQGVPWEFSQAAYSTRLGLYQCRKNDEGAMMSIGLIENLGSDIILETDSSNGTSSENILTNYTLQFSKGYYAGNNGNGRMPVDTNRINTNTDGAVTSWEQSANQVDPSWVGESAFVSQDLQSLIIDLLLGTWNVDTSGAGGVREANMAAWLPFPWADADKIISFGTVNAVFDNIRWGTDFPRTVYSDYANETVEQNYVALPYNHAEHKTVGDILRNILERIGAFMVYDRGQLSFGSWIGNGAWPKTVNDTMLSRPAISLSFDRSNALQKVDVHGIVVGGESGEIRIVPINNADRVLAGSGKSIKTGNFMLQLPSTPITLTRAFQTGVSLIQKYSQAAGIIEVNYLESFVSLSVGQEVFFSSQYVPNGGGSMGVLNASGTVLKASRSWQDGSTSYTLFLPGYIFASNRPSVIAVSGRVLSVTNVSGNTVMLIESNAYTDFALQAVPNAPISDADAFQQTLDQNAGSPLPCALYDEFGTAYGVSSSLQAVGVGIDELTFSGTDFMVAVTGDIVLLELIVPALDIEECWDAFQADAVGEVDGSTDYAYPWVR